MRALLAQVALALLAPVALVLLARVALVLLAPVGPAPTPHLRGKIKNEN